MEIVRNIDDLNREVFNFSWFDRTLILNSYWLQSKDSTRHRTWNFKLRYERLSSRDSSMEEAQVPITEGIISEALDMGRKEVNYKTWKQYKK